MSYKKPETHWCRAELTQGEITRQPGNWRDCAICRQVNQQAAWGAPALTGEYHDHRADPFEQYGEHNDCGAGDPAYFGDK
jgi:hypothetical protein